MSKQKFKHKKVPLLLNVFIRLRFLCVNIPANVPAAKKYVVATAMFGKAVRPELGCWSDRWHRQIRWKEVTKDDKESLENARRLESVKHIG